MQEEATQYILSPHIYLAVFSDERMGILLDMRHEYYEKITACTDWLMFFQKPHSLEDVYQHHADIHSDLLSPFVQHCIEHKYIYEASSELTSLPTFPLAPIGRKRIFLLQLLRLFPFSLAHHLESYFLIDAIDHILESHACYALIQYITQLAPSQSVPEHLLQKLYRGIRASAIVHKSEASCLHQSLALFWMLRSRGYHANVQIRIQLDPFLAHMIVFEGKERVLWWQTGSVPQQYYQQFLSSTTPIFSSDSLQTQIFLEGGET